MFVRSAKLLPENLNTPAACIGFSPYFKSASFSKYKLYSSGKCTSVAVLYFLFISETSVPLVIFFPRQLYLMQQNIIHLSFSSLLKQKLCILCYYHLDLNFQWHCINCSKFPVGRWTQY